MGKKKHAGKFLEKNKKNKNQIFSAEKFQKN